MSRERERHALLAFAVGVVLIAGAVTALLVGTTPDLDNLPAYECRPGHHHTTKECD